MNNGKKIRLAGSALRPLPRRRDLSTPIIEDSARNGQRKIDLHRQRRV